MIGVSKPTTGSLASVNFPRNSFVGIIDVRFPHSPQTGTEQNLRLLSARYTFIADGGSKDENESEAEVCSGRCRVDGAGGADYIHRDSGQNRLPLQIHSHLCFLRQL